jgi:hypothetical protein
MHNKAYKFRKVKTTNNLGRGIRIQSKNVHSQTSKNVQNLNSHVKQLFYWMEQRSLILFSLFTEAMFDQVSKLWLIIFSEGSGMLINGDISSISRSTNSVFSRRSHCANGVQLSW